MSSDPRYGFAKPDQGSVMAAPTYTILQDRGLLAVSGVDAREFLQGLISNDVDRVSPKSTLYAALLTPQGKYLFDFFVAEWQGGVVLDCEKQRLVDLVKRLSMYKLRADVELTDLSGELAVAALGGDGVAGTLGVVDEPGRTAIFGDGIAFIDPRLATIGGRAILPAETAAEGLAAAGFEEGAAADLEARRLALGLPDGSRDLVVDKSVLLESGFDELNGVDWGKGCYVGQELTARTKYRGLVKRRLVPVEIEGPLPEPGTPVMAGEREAGEIRSGADGLALALIRLEHLDDGAPPLTAGDSTVIPKKPDWAVF